MHGGGTHDDHRVAVAGNTIRELAAKRQRKKNRT